MRPHDPLERRNIDTQSQSDSQVWDPGVPNGPFVARIPKSICSIIAKAWVAPVDGPESLHTSGSESDADALDSSDGGSRTDLDSHANMPVVGRNAYIIADTGNKADVNAYTPDYEPMRVPIVDAAVQYQCPYDGTVYILVIRNALHVPSMENNLIPPFVMRENGIQVNDTPKIQVSDPSVDDHSIYFPESELRIPLSLCGTFSYFSTSEPTVQMMNDCEDVYLLTPTRWNPHDDSYATNEENMVDWEGNMVEKQYRKQVLLSSVAENKEMAASMLIGSMESKAVDQVFERSHYNQDVMPDLPYLYVPPASDQVASVLADVDPLLNDRTLYHRMSERAEIGKFQMSIGSTDVNKTLGEHDVIVETVTDDDETVLDEDDYSPVADDDADYESREQSILDEVFQRGVSGDLDLDEIMVSAAHADRSQGVDAEHLSKIWKISLDEANKTLDITSQTRVHKDDPKLSRNYGTNDRMLRYKRIGEYFFMDTFYATSKAGKSSRGHTCCQLFVTDKGFVFVVPMKSKSEVLQAVKQFAKEIGVPDALISDAAGEQRSNALRKFCSEIGTTLRVLEEGTPWANKAELYIGLIKEAVRKDMKESNCPLAFWDYCVERRARINNLTAKDRFNLHGSNAHTALTGEEGDISNLCQYRWYEWCYFRENKEKFPFNREVLGRILGPAKGEGNEMAQWVLKANGNVVPRRSHRPLNVAEWHSPEEKKKRDVFDALIERRWGTAIKAPPKETEKWEEYSDENEDPRVVPNIEDTVDANGRCCSLID